MTDITFVVGKRYLVRRLTCNPFSIKVIELSPDKEYVHFKYSASSCTGWQKAKEIIIICKLEDIEPLEKPEKLKERETIIIHPSPVIWPRPEKKYPYPYWNEPSPPLKPWKRYIC